MLNVGKEVSLLVRMSTKQLRQKYYEVFGEENNSLGDYHIDTPALTGFSNGNLVLEHFGFPYCAFSRRSS
jgi:hypothetical protein